MFNIGYDDPFEMELFINFIILYSNLAAIMCHKHFFIEVEINRDTDSD